MKLNIHLKILFHLKYQLSIPDRLPEGGHEYSLKTRSANL